MNQVFCKRMQRDQLDALRIEHPLFNATLLLQGAQLLEFSPRNNQFNNLLWLSDSAEYKRGQSVRGGIPICWPWFGNLAKNPAALQQQVPKPTEVGAHGFARNLAWDISLIHEDCHYVQIELTLQASKESKSIWPFDFNLTARFTFSQTLEVELITTNLDEQNVHISQAMHTYLPTQDIKKTYIHNAHNSRYIDALDNWQEKLQKGRIAFNQETDRLYLFSDTNNTQGHELRVESPSQQLLINNEQSHSAVIWNPWIEKSQRLSQFNNKDFHKMFCIETANVVSDAKQLNSKKSCTLKLILSKL